MFNVEKATHRKELSQQVDWDRIAERVLEQFRSLLPPEQEVVVRDYQIQAPLKYLCPLCGRYWKQSDPERILGVVPHVRVSTYPEGDLFRTYGVCYDQDFCEQWPLIRAEAIQFQEAVR